MSSHPPILDSSLEPTSSHLPILTTLGIESPKQELDVRGHNQTDNREPGEDGEAERGDRMGAKMKDEICEVGQTVKDG